MLLPTPWLLIDVLTFNGVLPANETLIDVLGLVATLVAVPFLGLVLVRALDPAFLHLPAHNRRIVVVAVAAVGAFLGARNDLFLSCEEFKVSEDDQPETCRSVQTKTEAQSLAPSLVAEPAERTRAAAPVRLSASV